MFSKAVCLRVMKIEIVLLRVKAYYAFYHSSGLVQQDLDTNNSVSEIVADSGKAYLYFYSDAAYNMTGFELHYS